MAERSAIFESVQIGKETTAGTAVAAGKKLLATSFEVGPNIEVDIFRPMGYKFNTIASLNQESVEGDISGAMSYTDLIYLFASLVADDTPATVGTTGKEWVFTSDSDGPDTSITYTIEQGSSVRAHKFAYGQVSGLTLSFSREGNEVSGTIMGKALTDGITLTTTPTEIALEPVMPTQVGVKMADTAAGLTAASYLTRFLSCEWSLTDRFVPLWTLNQSTSFDVTLEGEPSTELTMLMEADSVGMGLLTTMRAGSTKFVRIAAIGPVIGAGPATYELEIDTAVKITDVSPIHAEDEIIAVEWTGEFVHDATWTKAFSVRIVNALTAL